MAGTAEQTSVELYPVYDASGLERNEKPRIVVDILPLLAELDEVLEFDNQQLAA